MIDGTLDITPLPPQEAIDYLRGKGLQPSWDWRDMWQEEHARAFTVAKVTKTGILADIRQALDDAMAGGTSYEQFKKDLMPTLKRKGWWGRQEGINLDTGEIRDVQLGSPRRLKTIFNVNIQTSLQVGHYRAMSDPAVLAARPYWRYSSVMDGRTRPMHASWNNIVLPAGSPWWDTHFPPNGWNCRCTVVSMSQREIDRDGLTVSPEPEQRYVDWTNPGTGLMERIPEGIDPGWAYNPGKAASAQAQALAGETVIQSPAPLRWQLLNDLRSEAIAKNFESWTSRLLDPDNQFAPGRHKTTGAIATVDHLSRNLVEQLEALGHPPETTAISIADNDWFHLQHGEQPSKSKRSEENLLTREQALKLPALMRNSTAVVWDAQDNRLLYVFETAVDGKQGKAAIAVNYRMKSGIGNSVRSAGLVNLGDISAGKRYRLLEGKL